MIMQDFATTTTAIRRDPVPDEWLTLAVVSLTVNACTLLRGVVSHAVHFVVRRSSRRRGNWSELVDCESGVGRRSTLKKIRCDEQFVSA